MPFSFLERRNCRRAIAYLNVLLFGCILYVDWALPVAEVANRPENINSIVPAAYAFLIWFVIDIYLAVYVISECFMREEDEVSSGLISLLFSFSCILNAAVIILFTGELRLPSVAVFVTLWFNLTLIYIVLATQIHPKFVAFPNVLRREYISRSNKDYYLRRVPLTIYYGWISAAALVTIYSNVPDSLKQYDNWAFRVAVVTLLGVLNQLSLILLSDIVFSAVTLWGLIAICVRAYEFHDDTALAVALAVSVLCTFTTISAVSFAVYTKFRSGYERIQRSGEDYGTMGP